MVNVVVFCSVTSLLNGMVRLQSDSAKPFFAPALEVKTI